MAPSNHKRTWLIIGIATAVVALCIMTGCLLLVLTNYTISYTSSSATVGTIMKPIVEFFLVIAVGLFPPVFGSLIYPNNREIQALQTNVQRLLSNWVIPIGQIAAVLYIVLNHPLGIHSIGILTGDVDASYTAILEGTSVLILFLFLYAKVLQWRQRKSNQEPKPFDFTTPVAERIIRYKKFWERFSYAIVLFFMVVGEEIISRGYLVLFMGNRTHTFIPWIIISIGFTIVCHLYQGKGINLILFHTLFAIFFIAVTLITRNLFAAIVPHFLFDLMNAIRTWKLFDQQNKKPMESIYSTREKGFYLTFISINFIILVGVALLVPVISVKVG